MTGVHLAQGGNNVLGYRKGGGTVTQATSKATAVEINATSGNIITHNAELAGAADVQFVVNNDLVEPNDVVVVAVAGASAATGLYEACVSKVDAGSFQVSLRNVGATASEVVTINFAVIKSVIE